ncbi:hypothetical protein K239x_27770 [Planctomycetes bacterium K23_9]|uniref:Uncharacterized protein n=1 Tax=Stieleria marina TaxID=1930275 RepID=A0A517NUJ6_9BACT|nr:hypothetical protein K239x_27770 [Planctomycetes bacterium K23_9]
MTKPNCSRGSYQRTVVWGSDLEEGESEGLPVWSPHVADPVLASNLGPGSLETTDIHVSESWIQTDLEDPELSSD